MRGDVGLEGTRARLLAAAALEIRLIGPKRMTISGLAGRLGMSHANVYRYFADKQAIIDAVLNVWLRGLETRLQEIVDGPDPADDKLERFLATLTRAYVETLANDRALFQLLAEPGETAIEAERHRRRIESFVERIVEEGSATRLFSGGDVRRMAMLALDLAHRFSDPAALWRVERQPGPSDSRRDRVIRWAVRALTVRK
ncbi:MAG: TetR family transcriptional [Beijerinckiaceae bacterium]|nr:MAG: TetR family transcriptional [Beijerinckiaceae bacterium]